MVFGEICVVEYSCNSNERVGSAGPFSTSQNVAVVPQTHFVEGCLKFWNRNKFGCL